MAGSALALRQLLAILHIGRSQQGLDGFKRRRRDGRDSLDRGGFANLNCTFLKRGRVHNQAANHASSAEGDARRQDGSENLVHFKTVTHGQALPHTGPCQPVCTRGPASLRQAEHIDHPSRRQGGRSPFPCVPSLSFPPAWPRPACPVSRWPIFMAAP